VSGPRSARWSRRASPGGRDFPRGASLLLGVALACFPPPAAVHAQSTPRPTLTVAATLSAGAETETPVPIQVGPAASLPRDSFIRVHGLPPLAALSVGHSIAPGAWAIPVGALPGLKITVPRGATSSSDLIFTVVAADGTVLAEARSRLMIIPPPAAPAAILRAGTPPPASPDREIPPTAPPVRGPDLKPAERERALRLINKGHEQLAEGGIAQARLLYERAAEAGLALGAMALAATYDPAELDRLGVQGLQPDRAEAAKWYERARQLGATEATQRLQRLGAR